MPLISWIAGRYFRSQRVGRYASLLTFTAIASVAIGMLSLVLVMSVMRGFRAELTDRLLGFNAHISIINKNSGEPILKEKIDQIFEGIGVLDSSPFVQGEVIAESNSSGDLLAQGVRVRGVDINELGQMKKVHYYFSEDGEGFSSLEEKKSRPSGVIVGNEIALQLSLHPDFRDRLELVAPLAEILPSGELGPNKRIYQVSGVFKTGVYEYDNKYVLVSIPEAEKLLGLQKEEGWMIRLNDPSSVREVLQKIKGKIPEGWIAEGWNEQNKKLFSALKLERIAMGGVLTMALLIASFAIVGVVLLVTSAKRKDIAILECIGMTKRNIGKVFLMHAAFIGGLGSSIGLVCGLAICVVIYFRPIRLPDSYYLEYLPVDINLPVVILFALTGIAVAVVSSIYPVKQAMKLSPVEVLRYE